MGLYKYKPEPSGSMGALWALASLRDAAVLEFGLMGHMVDARIALEKSGLGGRTASLYSTHIDDIDITMGGIDRISDALNNISADPSIKAVFLLPSAVPEIIGTDFAALAEELGPQYPQFDLIELGFSGLTTDVNQGVRGTLSALVKHLPRDIAKDSAPTFNIIGSCFDFLRFYADAAEMSRIMTGAFGMKPRCILTSDTLVEDIKSMGAAHINLVLRKEGLEAAQTLQSRFGTPFLPGRPYGLKATMDWIGKVSEITGIKPDKTFVDGEYKELDFFYDVFQKLYRRSKFYGRTEIRLSAAAHSDMVQGLAACADELNFERHCFWCTNPDGGTADIPYLSEAEWEKLVPEIKNDILMASGDVLALAGKQQQNILFTLPHRMWNLCMYDAPFMGFRGGVNLVSIWLREMQNVSG